VFCGLSKDPAPKSGVSSPRISTGGTQTVDVF
jgi:hypothetical protein